MNKASFVPLLLMISAALQGEEPKLNPLPVPLSNNAVAISRGGKDAQIFSFMGIGAKKTPDTVTNQAFSLDLSTGKWTELRPVPGVSGRIAASAVSLRDQVVLLGGYIMDSRGGEVTVPDVNIFVPQENRW